MCSILVFLHQEGLTPLLSFPGHLAAAPDDLVPVDADLGLDLETPGGLLLELVVELGVGEEGFAGDAGSQLRQTPPSLARSMMATFMPSWAARMGADVATGATGTDDDEVRSVTIRHEGSPMVPRVGAGENYRLQARDVSAMGGGGGGAGWGYWWGVAARV